MTDSIIKFIETGKFSVREFASVVAQTVKIELAGIAARGGNSRNLRDCYGLCCLSDWRPQSRVTL